MLQKVLAGKVIICNLHKAIKYTNFLSSTTRLIYVTTPNQIIPKSSKSFDDDHKSTSTSFIIPEIGKNQEFNNN